MLKGNSRTRIQSWARATVALVSVAALVLLMGYEIGPEAAWPIAALQYIPQILFALPALAAVALSFTIGRSWQVVSICVFIALVVLAMGLKFSVGGRGEERVRLMTYNVKAGPALTGPMGLWPIKFEIAQHNADIVVLQDAQALVALFGERPEIRPLIFGGRHVFSAGQHVVASRHALEDCTSIENHVGPHHDNYVRCVVAIKGRKFDLFSVHILSPRKGLYAMRQSRFGGIDYWEQNIRDRMMQAENLAGMLRASVRPVVVAGDFNAPEQSLVIRTLLNAGVRDAFSAAGKGFGYTYGHALRYGLSGLGYSHQEAARYGLSFMRVDHVLVSPEIGVVDCFVGGGEASAHRPVIADLVLDKVTRGR